MITCKIVEHLLKLHFSIETSAISFVTNIVDPLLYSPGMFFSLLYFTLFMFFILIIRIHQDSRIRRDN